MKRIEKVDDPEDKAQLNLKMLKYMDEAEK
jgi:hypothetical protein